MNQLYNKRIAQRKKGKPQDYWDVVRDAITRKRNNQMRDMVNKSAKLVIDHCIRNGLLPLVIGWNQGIKDECNMGRRENQKFVQMPLAKLKTRISQLCEQHGIRFVETEEANTRAASYLDGDSLPEHGQKPSGWKASGKRSPRGLYTTADKSKVNADLNGAANILRKVTGNLGIDLSRLARRWRTTVSRIRIWATPKFNPCPKESSVSLDLRESTPFYSLSLVRGYTTQRCSFSKSMRDDLTNPSSLASTTASMLVPSLAIRVPRSISSPGTYFP